MSDYEETFYDGEPAYGGLYYRVIDGKICTATGRKPLKRLGPYYTLHKTRGGKKYLAIWKRHRDGYGLKCVAEFRWFR